MYPRARFSGGRLIFLFDENKIFPFSKISPWSGRTSPAIQFNNVVLPLPEGPKIADIPSVKDSEALRLKEQVFFLRFAFKKAFIWLQFSVYVLKHGVSIGLNMSGSRKGELVG